MEENKEIGPYFTKETTNMVKGIALIFMFIHHFFTFPEWYVEGIAYPQLEAFATYFCLPFKICVPIFAFLTGYFYSFACHKNYRYSIRKITDVLIPYWLIYLPFLIIALALGYTSFDLKSVLLEFFSLKSSILCFGWYIYFFIVVMLVLPIFHCFLTENKILAVVFGVVLPVLVCTVLAPKFDNPIFYYMRMYVPCITVGFLSAHFSLFQTLLDPIFKNHIKYKGLQALLWFCIAAAVFLGRYYFPSFYCGTLDFIDRNISLSFNLDIFYAPLFIYSIVNLIGLVPWKKIFLPLSYIGKYSLSMWLLHCIFFNSCRAVFQPVLYFPKIPILVLIWGLLLCFAAAVVVNIPAKRLIHLKNRWRFFCQA
ncbi:MAG: acyltransferase [Clostridiales bacterium]|jgi:hypothetical protein|nr:acyltransferase [Clostridiales bacterium]